MSTTNRRIGPVLMVATALVALSMGVSGAYGAVAPIKESLVSHYGWEVNETTKGPFCTAPEKCQPAGGGSGSGEPGGFQNPGDVAIGAKENGENLYVADGPNQRVQELTPAGKFVLMIGRDVNQTTGGDVCTQAEIESSNVKCKAGTAGAGKGQFSDPGSVAVDHAAHLLYVLDSQNHRIQEFTETGQFVLMSGKEVNQTTKGNLCTAASGNTCKAGVSGPPGGGTEPGVFSFGQSPGAKLAIGGPERLLYVSDTQRVQELDSEGKFKREISFPAGSTMVSLAVEENGDVYAVYQEGIGFSTTIHKLNEKGEPVLDGKGEPIVFQLAPRHPEAEVFGIAGIALDPFGRLAVSELETIREGATLVEAPFGSLISAGSGELITSFTITNRNDGGLVFNAKDELYLAINSSQFEVLGYRPVNVAELVTTPGLCPQGADRESDATFTCSLTGAVDPWGVPGTVVWFEWGNTSGLGEKTPPFELCGASCPSGALEPVSAPVEGVPPNESVYYRVAAFDQNVKAPEAPLIGKTLSMVTRLAAPRLLGAPRASFVKRSSAILFAELNPENASTHYWFQYTPAALCERLDGCAEAASTPVQQSAAYARIGSTAELTGLQPGSTYRYRLIAENENTAKTEKLIVKGEEEQEGTFTTSSAIVVAATTGPSSMVGATSAVISGSVEGDGQPVSYAFELGVSNGASTQYGVVYSGPVAASATPVSESLALSGLQPGTTYSYRISVRYGNGLTSGWSATGGAMSFTTQGLPEVLVSPSPLPMLGVPSISFPTAVKVAVKHGGKKTTKRHKKARARKRKKPSRGRK
jgi:NHL repeat